MIPVISLIPLSARTQSLSEALGGDIPWKGRKAAYYSREEGI
jgi:hypothetical protein